MGLLSGAWHLPGAVDAVVVVQWTLMLRLASPGGSRICNSVFEHCILHLRKSTCRMHYQRWATFRPWICHSSSLFREKEKAEARHGVDRAAEVARVGVRRLRACSILKTRASGIDLAMAAAGGSQGYAPEPTVEPAAVASVADIEEACWAEKGARQMFQVAGRAQMSDRWRFASPTVDCAQAGSNAHPNARWKFSLPSGVLPVAFPGTAKNGTTMWGLSRPSTSSGLT